MDKVLGHISIYPYIYIYIYIFLREAISRHYDTNLLQSWGNI